MTPSFALGDPRTGAEIERDLMSLQDEASEYLAAMPAADFFRPQGGKWSPSEHTRHLTKSIGAVARGLGMPWIVLRFKFGAHHGESRDLATITATYRSALANPLPVNPFAPDARPVPADIEAGRTTVLARFRGANAELRRAMRRWDEPALDRLRLPHPLIGKLTLREMLLFTLYHNAHHMRLVASRAKA